MFLSTFSCTELYWNSSLTKHRKKLLAHSRKNKKENTQTIGYRKNLDVLFLDAWIAAIKKMLFQLSLCL